MELVTWSMITWFLPASMGCTAAVSSGERGGKSMARVPGEQDINPKKKKINSKVTWKVGKSNLSMMNWNQRSLLSDKDVKVYITTWKPQWTYLCKARKFYFWISPAITIKCSKCLKTLKILQIRNISVHMHGFHLSLIYIWRIIILHQACFLEFFSEVAHGGSKQVEISMWYKKKKSFSCAQTPIN